VESLEITAKTVREAIERALARLGRRREEVDITVLSEGSRGLFGLGGEEARILVSVREEPPPTLRLPEPAVVGREVLEHLLRAMHVRARVEVHPAPPETEGVTAVLEIITDDEDLGLLLGRRGETLATLQYLTNLIVAKRVQRWCRLVVDIEGYRARRERALRNLALRMAERVQSTGQPVTLEAMPPAERRIIHLTLANHPAVTTASIGEGDQRRVVISPKQ